MPKDLFFKLNKEKRSQIIDSIIKEMSKYCYNDISINRIIKTANISRGSFYNYFNDKEDMVLFIIKNNGDRLFEINNNEILEENIDIFSKIEKFIEKILLNDNFESVQIMKNTMRGLTENDKEIKQFLFQFHRNMMLNLLKKDNTIYLENDEEKNAFVDILFYVSKNTFNKIYVDYENRYDYFEQYKNQLKLLRKKFKK